MVVDDEPDTLIMLKVMLKRAGFEVVTINNGRECLDKLEEVRPDLILMDVMMFGLDGWEVCKRIKEKEKTKSIPVLMITVRTSDVSKEKSLGYAHADGHLEKPVNKEKLLNKVNALLKEK